MFLSNCCAIRESSTEIGGLDARKYAMERIGEAPEIAQPEYERIAAA